MMKGGNKSYSSSAPLFQLPPETTELRLRHVPADGALPRVLGEEDILVFFPLLFSSVQPVCVITEESRKQAPR